MRNARLALLIFHCFLAAVAVTAKGAQAAEESPVNLIQGIYVMYADEAADTPSDFDLLYPFATPTLRGLMDREMECWKKDEGPCKYDFSAIVDGQDYEISEIDIKETTREKDTVEVTATFRNFGEPREVVYVFEESDGVFLLEDVQSRGDYPWSLKRILQD